MLNVIGGDGIFGLSGVTGKGWLCSSLNATGGLSSSPFGVFFFFSHFLCFLLPVSYFCSDIYFIMICELFV